MLLGIATGLVLHTAITAHTVLTNVTGGLGLLATIFLRAIRMIIAPLVFSTLLNGMGRIRETATVGRIALQALVWFFVASVIAIRGARAAAGRRRPGAGGRRT